MELLGWRILMCWEAKSAASPSSVRPLANPKLSRQYDILKLSFKRWHQSPCSPQDTAARPLSQGNSIQNTCQTYHSLGCLMGIHVECIFSLGKSSKPSFPNLLWDDNKGPYHVGSESWNGPWYCRFHISLFSTHKEDPQTPLAQVPWAIPIIVWSPLWGLSMASVEPAFSRRLWGENWLERCI